MKRIVSSLIVLLVCCFATNGCSGGGAEETSGDNSAQQVSEAEPENNDETESENPESGSAIELPDGFTEITQEEIATLPDTEGLIAAINNALGEIRVAGNVNMTFGNYDNTSGVFSLDGYGITQQGKHLLVSSTYISIAASPEWSVSYIKDADTGNYYYVPDEQKNAVDLYDYTTGELASEKTESLDEVQDRADEKVDEAESEFEGSLDNMGDNAADPEADTETSNGVKSREVTELELYGEPVVGSTINDMVEGYDYITDIDIEVDEPDSIQIVVQVPLGTDTDTAKMAGEDVARYLAAQASWANSYFKQPGSNDLGSLYDKYDLIVYVGDSAGAMKLTGAKAKSSPSFVWKD